MARYYGPNKYSGSLGGVTFYTRYGKNLVRLRSTLDKDKIYRNPKSKTTLQNCTEFGGCSKASAKFKRVLKYVQSSAFDFACLSPKLLSVFKRISLGSDGERGKRAIRLSQNKDMLNNLLLSGTTFAESEQKNVFSAPYSIDMDEDNLSTLFFMPAFKADQHIKKPKGATHFRVTLSVFQFPDYEYKEEGRCYSPIYNADMMPMEVVHSEYFSVSQMRVPEIRLEAALGDKAAELRGMNFFAVVGVTFWYKIGDCFEVIPKAGCMTLKTKSSGIERNVKVRYEKQHHLPVVKYEWVRIDELISRLKMNEVMKC
ncbi:MAG: hypothetical protein Q8880_10690 [Bacteroidota bacterium]|nr:hypothetical protein [Bacteroidota bacterium]